MSEQADRPGSSVLPLPAPYALATVRGRGLDAGPRRSCSSRASTLRQNLGGGGPAGGALARGRALAAVFFSHNPEAEAREGGESAEGYWRGGSGALARQAGGGRRVCCGTAVPRPLPQLLQRAAEETGARRRQRQWRSAWASLRHTESGGVPAAGRSGTLLGAPGPGQSQGAEASARPRRDAERPARGEPRLRL